MPRWDLETKRRNIIDEMQHLDEDRINLIRSQRCLPFAIAINNVTGGLNVGVLCRTANFLGAKEIFYFGRKHFDARSLVGCHKYTTIKYLDSLDKIKEVSQQYVMVGMENNCPNTQSIHDVNWPRKSCIIVGEEGNGLNQEIIDLCDMLVEIPGPARVTRSLNVSVAGSIAMFSYVQQHA